MPQSGLVGESLRRWPTWPTPANLVGTHRSPANWISGQACFEQNSSKRLFNSWALHMGK